jgi:IS5 family transposase
MYRRKGRKTIPLFPELFPFGGKGALVHVGGFLLLDYFDHRAFAEEELLKDHLLGYVDRFGKLPPSVVMDAKYGTNENREMIEELEVRASFKRRGR